MRWDSDGPALFRQERVGRHGKIFRIHKLRTMQLGAASQGPAVTTLADARVTPPAAGCATTASTNCRS